MCRLSQFERESEMLFPPRTQLQIVGSVVGDDGVAVVTLKPAYPRTSRRGADVSSERGTAADDIQPHVGIEQ